MRLRARAFFAFLFWGLAPSSAAHAVAEMETQRLRHPGEVSLLELSASLNKSVGNTDLGSWKIGGVRLTRSHGFERVFLLDREQANAFGLRSADRGKIQAVFAWPSPGTIAAEAYGQVVTDRFRRLSYRSLIGGGARVQWLERKK